MPSSAVPGTTIPTGLHAKAPDLATRRQSGPRAKAFATDAQAVQRRGPRLQQIRAVPRRRPSREVHHPVTTRLRLAHDPRTSPRLPDPLPPHRRKGKSWGAPRPSPRRGAQARARFSCKSLRPSRRRPGCPSVVRGPPIPAANHPHRRVLRHSRFALCRWGRVEGQALALHRFKAFAQRRGPHIGQRPNARRQSPSAGPDMTKNYALSVLGHPVTSGREVVGQGQQRPKPSGGEQQRLPPPAHGEECTRSYAASLPLVRYL